MVSVPVDLGSSEQMVALEEKGIKARHVRVERIEELDGGVIEWRMATCEDHGGMIPRSCQDRRMPEIIAKVRIFRSNRLKVMLKNVHRM